MRPQLNFSIKNEAKTSPEILIYSTIGEDFWTGEGVTAKRLREDVAALGPLTELHVRINSEGGSVFEGQAIYNYLKELSQKGTRIVTTIDSAMSIASVIAMAGDEIRAHENGVLMIHDPYCGCFGTAADMRKAAIFLDTMTAQIRDVYVARTKNEAPQVAAWMAEEKWMTAAEAKDRKFVDVVLPNKGAPPTVSDLAVKTARNAPEWAKSRVAAMATPRLSAAARRLRLANADEPAPKRLPVLVCDFDGVLHSYTSGWQGATTVADGPVDGAADFLESAVDAFEVNVLSSRSKEEGGIDAMKAWLTKVLSDAEKPADLIDRILWPTSKPAATVTLDDRAITFTGTFPTVDELLAFKPWNK
jgi:ATP-dependent Clp protease protease subunit